MKKTTKAKEKLVNRNGRPSLKEDREKRKKQKKFGAAV
jgi:hypothetical protein